MELSTKETLTMKWYAIRTQNNKEKHVLERLRDELEWEGKSRLVENIVIPTQKMVEIKDSKKREREKIIYPGYIFIQTSSLGEINNILKTIKGCTGFVRTRSGDILPMKSREIDSILSLMEENNSKTFEEIFVKDEEILITEGPFSGFKGTIDTIDLEKGKIKVFVKIFGRPTSVDLTRMQIKKI
jgi:transcriptional antiterminator NusG